MDVRVHSSFETTLAPSLVVDALVDMTPQRPLIWPHLDPARFVVRDRGDGWAIVMEGDRQLPIWQLARYEWSTPGTVTWTVLESNFCTPGDGIRVVVVPLPGGGSQVDIYWRRRPTSLLGSMIAVVHRIAGTRTLRSSYSRVFERLAAEAAPEP
ncbi:MAG: hypothetical protein OEX05_04900 [Chloroflexota bacterium]|jgi:hypothetical protein|nr:hypothetical protein [Chloroflexota bacterium]